MYNVNYLHKCKYILLIVLCTYVIETSNAHLVYCGTPPYTAALMGSCGQSFRGFPNYNSEVVLYTAQCSWDRAGSVLIRRVSCIQVVFCREVPLYYKN